jgi:hypothetical protein
MSRQADAALLGVWDFICGRHGAPDLARKAPWTAKLLCRVLKSVHEAQVHGTDAVKTPAA